MSQINITNVCVITLTAVVLLLATDKSGSWNREIYVPPPKPVPVAAAVPNPDKGKPPPHNDKVEDLPEGKGRETTFYTCTACHGVALIKAQGLTRDLWDSSIDLMQEKHRMPQVKAEDRAEILAYLTEQFPPRRRGRNSDNPFLK